MSINRPKRIVLVPVKNEDWILEFFLSSVSLWADHIIVADQNSTDTTPEICKKFEKVVYVQNMHQGLNMSIARQLVLDEARKIPGNNILFSLDADEALSANVVHDVHFWEQLNNLQEGHSIELQWITLRGSPRTYRNDDSIWSNSWKHFIFRDDRKGNYNLDIATSEPRMPEYYMKHSKRSHSVVNLHFQFVDMERMFAKQRRYRIYDYINSAKKNFLTCLKINSIYYSTKMVSGMKLSSTLSDWISGYESFFEKFFSKKVSIYRYDEDSLSMIKKYGVHYFAGLDIWDVDWQYIANQLHVHGRFKDPRNIFVKWYHRSQSLLAKLIAIIPMALKKYL